MLLIAREQDGHLIINDHHRGWTTAAPEEHYLPFKYKGIIRKIEGGVRNASGLSLTVWKYLPTASSHRYSEKVWYLFSQAFIAVPRFKCHISTLKIITTTCQVLTKHMSFHF